jgi:hypothetical protein
MAESSLANLRGQRRAYAVRLAQVKHEAGVLGLYQTLQALDAATRAVGYEIADLETGKRGDPVAKGIQKSGEIWNLKRRLRVTETGGAK